MGKFVSITLVVDQTAYARVAQLVERDLAKVEAAGSSPVSRFFHARRVSCVRRMPFLHERALPGLEGSRSRLPARSARDHGVHRTPRAVSRFFHARRVSCIRRMPFLHERALPELEGSRSRLPYFALEGSRPENLSEGLLLHIIRNKQNGQEVCL